MRNNKKAQVAVFIIIGIVLLSAAFTTFYILTREKVGLEEFKEPIIEELPLELQPVNIYVADCLREVSERGIRLIGEHGGYTNISNWAMKFDNFDPTRGDMVDFLGGMPYWFYMSDKNDCMTSCDFDSKAPALYRPAHPSIEGQLDDYIKSDLKVCINNFDTFRRQGIIITETGEMVVTTSVLENDVAFHVDWPLQAEIGESTQAFGEFFVRQPINLKQVYALALDMAKTEYGEAFLERYIFNMIAASSGTENAKLPPLPGATELDYSGSKFWVNIETEEKVKDVISSSIPMLKVIGTKNGGARPGDNFIQNSFFNKGSTIFTAASYAGNYTDLAITFSYMGWPIYFKTNCKAGFCHSESASAGLIGQLIGTLIGMQRYNTAYDVSFPVMVEIEDDAAFNNEGYFFRFFLEGNIRRNEPMKVDNLLVQVRGRDDTTMMCNLNQRHSGNITINVTDALTGEPLEGVGVLYSFQDIETCPHFRKTGPDGTVTQRFPIIHVGGNLFLTRPDYPPYFQSYRTEVGKNDKLDIKLEPYRRKKLKIIKKRMVKDADTAEWQPSFADDVPLSRREFAMMFMTRPAGEGYNAHFQVAKYVEEEGFNITLVPGTYDIDMQLFYTEPFTIMPDYRVEGSEGFYIPPEPVVMKDGFIVGGLDMNYTFTKEMLDSGDTLVLYAINPDLPSLPATGVRGKRTIEDLDEVMKIREYSDTYRSVLEPKVVTS